MLLLKNISPHIRKPYRFPPYHSIRDGGRLSLSFSSDWEEGSKGLKGALRPVPPLKDRFEKAIKRIELQINKIDEHIERYSRREKDMSEKIVWAYERHDESRAKMLANELSEIRRHKSLLIDSKISLDKTALRLRTLYEYGNFMSAISLARKVIGETREKISSVTPEISSELAQVEKILDEMTIEVGRSALESLNFSAESIEAEKILEEAAIIANSRINESFPKTSKNKLNNNDYSK